ncbi:MAG: sigma-70 family RNA polymerase sigma factor [Gemmatimonadaceae bacterium]|nr:sigma-70 family RNA polymerase sigma factor [Gemmatimonadaceae bacterium]
MITAFRVARGGTPEPKAFEELLAANLDSLYRTALRLCGGRTEEAEDLLQDSVLRAFAKRDNLRDPRAGRSWLFTTLVRTHLNRVRSERRRRETLESDFDDRQFEAALAGWSQSETPDERLDRDATRAAVRTAIDGLDPELREVLLLTDLEDFSHREAAAMLEIPEGTVASRLFRARAALRSALTAQTTQRQIRRSV